MTELAVRAEDWLAGRTLADPALRDEGVVVLGVTRPGGRYVGAPSGATEIRTGDLLVLYGREEASAGVDDRPRGALGDTAHDQAVARQARAEVDEASADGALLPGDERTEQQ